MNQPAVAVLLAAGSLVLPFGGEAHRKTAEGNRHYLDGLYQDALRAYTEAQVAAPEAPQLFYDIGNVLYRQEDFEGAAEAYTRALFSAPLGLAGDVAYNLGNARYQQQEYAAARDAYRRALRADPTDTDAKRNLELTLRAMERQEQKQEGQGDPQKGEPQEPGDEQSPGEPEPQDPAKPEQRQSEPGQEPDSQAGGSGDPPPAGTPQDGAGGMTQAQAERLLDSVAEGEEQLLKARMRAKGPVRRREKDW